MNNKIIKQFCQSVGKRLICLPSTKQKLLHGLIEELENLPSDAVSSITALEQCVGSPKEVASELQSSVSTPEYERILQQKNRRLLFAFGVVFCVSFAMLVLAVLYFQNAPYYIVETISEVS